MSEDAANEVLKFWFEDIEHSCWFKKDPEFDRQLEDRFGELLKLAKTGALDDWCNSPQSCLALVVVLDQFSRNINREKPASFEADAQALQLCLNGIEEGLDLELTLEQRSFFYLPLRHAEDLKMQKLGLVKTRELNTAGYGTDKYALNHLALIERFGRFPHRNSCLGRRNTDKEELYLADGKAGF